MLNVRHFFDVTFPQKSQHWIDRLTDNFRLMDSPLWGHNLIQLKLLFFILLIPLLTTMPFIAFGFAVGRGNIFHLSEVLWLEAAASLCIAGVILLMFIYYPKTRRKNSAEPIMQSQIIAQNLRDEEEPMNERLRARIHDPKVNSKKLKIKDIMWPLFFLSLPAFLIVVTVTLDVNKYLDNGGIIREVDLPILHKYSSSVRGRTTYRVAVPNPVPSFFALFNSSELDIVMDYHIYKTVIPGRSWIKLKIHKGVLGLNWYDNDYIDNIE